MVSISACATALIKEQKLGPQVVWLCSRLRKFFDHNWLLEVMEDDNGERHVVLTLDTKMTKGDLFFFDMVWEKFVVRQNIPILCVIPY